MKWPFRLLVGLSVLALLFLCVFFWAYRYRNDEFLARYIMQQNSSLRGRLELGRVHWGLQALLDLAMGTPTAVTIEKFAVYDPWGAEVLHAPHVTGKIELLPLVSGGHLVVHGLRARGVRCLVAERASARGTEIGFLAAFGAVKPAHSSSGRGSRVELLDYDLQDAEVTLRFAHWSLALRGLKTRGSFVLTGGDPAVEGVLYQLQPQAEAGLLTIAGVELPLRQLRARQFQVSPDQPMDLRSELSVEAAGAQVELQGALLGIYRPGPRIDVNISSRSAQQVLSRLFGSAAAGPGRILATLRGPLGRPTIEGKVYDLALGAPPLRVSGLRAEVILDTVKSRIGVSNARGQLLGGSIEGSGGLNLGTGNWSARASLSGVQPGALDPMVAGQLAGKVAMRGGLWPDPRAQVEMNLELLRPRRDWIPQRLRIGGTAHLNPAILDLSGLMLEGEGNRIIAQGSINIPARRVNLRLQVDAARLGGWLAARGLPVYAQSGTAALQLAGPWPDLRATGSLGLRGVGHGPLRVPRVSAGVDLNHGTLVLKKIGGDAFGGALSGEASLQLFEGKLTRPLAEPLVQARLTGVGVDLAALGTAPHAQGRLNFEAEVSGPVSGLTGAITFRLPEATILGERFDGSWGKLGLLADRISVYQGHLRRTRGGELDVLGAVHFDGNLDLRLTPRSFPLAGIPSVSDLPVPIGGNIDGTVAVTGPLSDPRLEGRINLTQASVRGVSLGSGAVTLTPGSDGVRIGGQLLGRQLLLDGYFLPSPRPRLHLTLDVSRLPLERLVIEMQRLGKLRSTIDGRIQLAVDQSGVTSASARLTRADVSLGYRPPGERRERTIVLTNQQDLRAVYDGKRVQLEPVGLVTRLEDDRTHQAELKLGGWLSPAGLDLRLRGKVPVQILELVLARQVTRLGGEATANLRLSGPLENPSLEGSLGLERVAIQLRRFERPLEIRRGRLRLLPGRVLVDELGLQVGRAKLDAKGEIGLEHLRPATVNLRIAGDVNARLLELFYPEAVSQASGAAWVDVSMNGPVRDPRFAGKLIVRQLELAPRGWGRTITLERGEIALSNYVITTRRALEGTYDEGSIRLEGEVRLDNWDPVDIYVKIAGSGIPQRQPGVYTAEANTNLVLLGDSGQLALQGDVDLVDMRYTRKYEIFSQAFFKPRVFEEETPFWKGIPVLENLQLRLQVQSIGQLAVKNNLAELSLSAALGVTGTLSDPRLGGQIRVEQGTFSVPLTRGEYKVSRGEINFDERKPIDEARFEIIGETLVADRSGVDYQIRLALLGTLDQIGMQLSSTPHLDQGQILALLAFGRTTDQLRKDLKGSESGGTGGGGQAAAADAQVKELTGAMIDAAISDSLQKVTHLDLLRFEVGTESAQVRGVKKLGQYVTVRGLYEYGLLGDSRAEGSVEGWASDLLTLVLKFEHISTRLQLDDLTPNRVRGGLLFRLPLR